MRNRQAGGENVREESYQLEEDLLSPCLLRERQCQTNEPHVETGMLRDAR
jgi:hypothetical protein